MEFVADADSNVVTCVGSASGRAGAGEEEDLTEESEETEESGESESAQESEEKANENS